MAPSTCAFAAPLALVRAPAAAATCARTLAAVRMSAGDDKAKGKQSFWAWLDSKIMPHQADWDETMSENYMREVMDAREDAMEKAYKEAEK